MTILTEDEATTPPAPITRPRGGVALGAVAVGALAAGALAIGDLVVRRLMVLERRERSTGAAPGAG